MNQVQLARSLWEHFGINPLDYAKMTDEDRALYAMEIHRIESDKRRVARKAY